VRAIRAVVRGEVQGVGFRHAAVELARRLGLMGWVRNGEDGAVELHAEGARAALEELEGFLRVGPPAARVAELAVEEVPVEGHEQFAVRGLRAGAFVVQEWDGGARRFELHLQLGAAVRSWALPKGPSLDPAAKRLAVELGEGTMGSWDFEGSRGGERATVWDRGGYEQGGRVAWPEALRRGHAVFVLHGAKLRGGFALQRTRPGARAQWLLIKRRDEHARPGSDAVERPHPSGR
jgi:DNA ligase D-like protein (predicted 3'-phosphoesterase)